MHFVYSFDESNIPFGLVVLVFVINIVVFLLFRTLKQSTNSPKVRFGDILFAMFFITFVVFYCLGTDYFTYRHWVDAGYSIYYSKEVVYTFLIDFVNNVGVSYPYELFRLIIWGSSVLLVFFSAKILKLRPLIVLLLLFLLFYDLFSYARGTLGMAMYILGATIFLNGKKYKIYYLFGVIVMAVSIIFHRQMLIGLGIFPIVFLPLDSKKVLRYSIPLIIIVIIAVSFVMSNTGIFGDRYTDEIENFTSQSATTPGMKISHLMAYSLFYISFIMVSVAFSKTKFNKIAPEALDLYKICFGLLISATTFWVIFSEENPIFYRTLYMSMMPLTLVLSYCYSNKLISKKSITMLLLYALAYHSIGILVELR